MCGPCDAIYSDSRLGLWRNTAVHPHKAACALTAGAARFLWNLSVCEAVYCAVCWRKFLNWSCCRGISIFTTEQCLVQMQGHQRCLPCGYA